MTNLVEIQASENLLHVRVTGTLTPEFYEDFVPAVESQIASVGKLRMLVELHDFQGWSAGALWEDIKFDARHWRDIERLAIVGERRWERGMAAFCKPFTTAQVRYFDHERIDEARRWLLEDD